MQQAVGQYGGALCGFCPYRRRFSHDHWHIYPNCSSGPGSNPAGAIIFVNAGAGLLKPYASELFFFIIVLLLLIYFLIAGNGPWSAEFDEEEERKKK